MLSETFAMTATLASTLASAGALCALALLLAVSLVLKGLALQPRSLASRVTSPLPAMICSSLSTVV